MTKEMSTALCEKCACAGRHQLANLVSGNRHEGHRGKRPETGYHKLQNGEDADAIWRTNQRRCKDGDVQGGKINKTRNNTPKTVARSATFRNDAIVNKVLRSHFLVRGDDMAFSE